VVEKKSALFKVIVLMVLQAPDLICETKPEVFANIMKVSEASDSLEIAEDAIWMISSILQLADSGRLHACIQSLNVAPFIFKTLQSQNESLALQSLRTLTVLAQH
jgi:hypothetical protein